MKGAGGENEVFTYNVHNLYHGGYEMHKYIEDGDQTIDAIKYKIMGGQFQSPQRAVGGESKISGVARVMAFHF